MGAADEPVNVVDEHDRVLRTVPRAEMRARNLRHRAVFLAVVDGVGDGARLLVHRRSEAKDVWPGWWDLAVGGVVTSGEGYDDAAVRELAEEVGLDAADVTPQPLGDPSRPGRYDDEHVSLLGRCYLVVVPDGPSRTLTFPDGEVVEARWVTAPELQALRHRHPFLPDSVALLLPRLPEGLAAFRA